MGSLTPILTNPLFTQGIGLVTSELSRQSSRVQRNDSLNQLQERQRLQEQQLSANAAQGRKKIALDASNAEEKRKAALKRAVSRQRANFGAQGIGNGVGSSQAVLLGLFEESDDERTRREGLDNLRLNAIDQDLNSRKSLNILQRTQLEERNKLSTISALNGTLSGVSGFASRAAKFYSS